MRSGNIVWADGIDQKADPFWSEDEGVPQYVIDAIAAVIDAGKGVYQDIEGFTDREINHLGEILKDRLTERSRWSLNPIASDI